MSSLGVVTVYVAIMGAFWYFFSKWYRAGKLKSAINQDSWFPPNEWKEKYEDLCEKEPDDINGLKGLLLKRAIEDAMRIGKLRSDRASLSDLMQKAAIGESTWHQFTAAEKEMEMEIQEVIEEAEALTAGWGATIFQNAAQLIAFERKKQMEQQGAPSSQ